MTKPRPFTHQVPDAEIAALRARLTATRWPDDVNDDSWGWGVKLPYLRELCAYWATDFDWRAAEAQLFAYPHALLEIDGLDLHFIHARSPHAHATPLLMTHGWPGSLFEFIDVMPRLLEPEKFGGNEADAFHLVLPSLQGYGFSPPATSPGMNQKTVGLRHAHLMKALGYSQYIAQGGDWGAIVSRHTAAQDPEHCIGLHLSMLPPIPPKGLANPMALVQPHEMRYLANMQAYRATGAGYFHQQATKPQTLAYGLTDSPAGWCAWVTEKFHDWTDCAGEIRNAVSWDRLLANISLYWFTNSIASASRFYKEFRLAEDSGAADPGRIETPTGIAVYPHDLTGCPRAWAEPLFPIVHWFDAPRGGHFAAMEQPEIFSSDLWAFINKIRK